MGQFSDWRSIERRLQGAPRGTRTRLASKLNIDRSQLARTLRTGGFPRVDQLQAIEAFFDENGDLAPALPDPRDRMRVPLYGFAVEGEGDRFAMTDAQALDHVELPRGMSVNGEFFLVQTPGSSMEPRIWPGERKLVQRGVPPGRGQDAVIEFHDGTAVLKTFQRERDGQVFALQYNPDREVRYDAASVRAIHAIFSL